MIYAQAALLFAIIIYAAKLGGIGVGMAGGIGMAIAVFGFGLKPGAIPIDVILIIMAIIFAVSVMQKSGGLEYMVRCAERILRGNPRYLNILAPLTTFTLTFLSGTGFTTMAVLNVIQQVAKENGVRPMQPLTSATIASQIAVTASPISAATAAMYVVIEGMGVPFASVLAVIVPSALFGTIVAAAISSMQGCALKDDPIYQERLAKGLVNLTPKEMKNTPISFEAKASVWLFLSGVVFIVGMLMFKKQIGHTLGSRDLIIMTMLLVGFAIYKICHLDLATIKRAPIFADGAESLVILLGIVWFSSTIIGAHTAEIKEVAAETLKQYPALVAVVFFCTSALLFSQGATSALLVPIAGSIGLGADAILASFAACSALYITNIYPTSMFSISCDDTGSYLSSRWNGSFVVNHPFFIPGCLGVIAAVPFGFFLAKIVL